MIPLLLGTHHYEWAIQPFANLYSKYFGNETVIYFGDRVEDDLPSNIEFQQVFPDWDWQTNFGEGLKYVCYSHPQDILLIFLLDHWLSEPVDRLVISQLEDYMINHPNVIRANLTDDTSWHTGEVECVEYWQDLEIIEVKPWSIHAGYNGGITFCPSLWQPKLLGQLVESYWSFWDCEKLGTNVIKIKYPNLKAVGSNPWGLKRIHGLFHAQPKQANLKGLSKVDQQIVIKSLPNEFTYIY